MIESEKEILTRSIQDFFSAKMLKFSILPFVISVLAMYLIFFIIAGIGLEQLGTLEVQTSQTTLQNAIEHTESFTAQLQGDAIIKFLMSYAVTSWIVSFLVYAIGGFFMLYVSIFVAVLVIGFLTPMVLKELQRRHYQDVELLGHSSIIEALFLIIKWTFVMFLLFLVFIPLYFIPLLNIIALNFPLYYFFHKVMTYDISSNICTREEDKKIKYLNANTLRMKTLALYLVSLIPFAIFFGAVFYVIYLGHTYFIEIRKMRAD
ncbi:EI24 domain-containing protein [bacterium]|nr:EI24 domain-containing protein [bacterium]MBU1993114.1 EI24 domain-containing protein [bacterium]